MKTLDANLRLSRTDGDIQLVTYHKPSDPLSAGDQGSQAAQIAKDLLNLSDVRILMGQDEAVAAELGRAAGAHARCSRSSSPAGRCRRRAAPCGWSATSGTRCRPLLTPLERRLTYTNDAIDPAV